MLRLLVLPFLFLAQTGTSQGQVRVKTVSVTGIVTEADTAGATIPWAVVLLTDLGSRTTRATATDARGSFRFDDVEPGRYSVSASRPGLFPRPEGSDSSETLLVTEAEPKTITLSLIRGASIAGRIRDRNGLPAANQPISLSQVQRYDDQLILEDSTVGTVVTDLRGAFRFFGLPPGKYFVSTAPMFPTLTTVPSYSDDADYALLLQSANSMTSISQTNVPVASDRRDDYAATFYPGSPSIDEATAVEVSPGENKVGIDFQMQFTATTLLRGSVIGPDGKMARNCTVLAQRVSNVWDFRRLAARFSSSSCQFTLGPVSAGNYEIRAWANNSFWAAQRLQVSSHSTQNAIELVVRPGLTVRGAVRAPEKDDGAVPETQITLFEAGTRGGVQLLSTRTMPDGSFSIAGVPPGRYRLDVKLPTPWLLGEIVGSGGDVSDSVFELIDNAGHEVLTIKTVRELSQLAGQVSGDVSKCVVLVFSRDRRYWITPSRRVIWTRVGFDRSYSLDGIPPGEYHVAVLNVFPPGGWFDPAFLSQLANQAPSVTLNQGLNRLNLTANR